MTSTITLQIGKTYVTRDGSLHVLIQAETNLNGTYSMQGEDDLGRITWRTRKGQFSRYLHPLDLTAEVA